MSATFRGHREIDALTGLRGIAASWVVLYHMHYKDPISGVFGVVLRHGYLAVDLFFVLSGFVMALSYQSLFAAGFSARAYGIFLLRRLARIYPLYICMTFFALACSIIFERSSFSFSGIELFCNLILVNAWGLAETIDGPAWSISTEFAAYLMFPVLAALILLGGRRPAAAAALVSLVVIALLPLVHMKPGISRHGPLDIYHGSWPVLRCVSEFCLGLAAFRFAQVPAVRGVLVRPATGWLIAAAVIILVALHGTDVLFVACLPVLIAVLYEGHAGLDKVFSNSVSMWLGRLSYAIYLLHFSLLRLRHFVDRLAAKLLSSINADLLGILAFYVLLLLLASVCYRWIEQPGRRLIRGLERGLEDQAPPVVAEPASSFAGS